VIDFTLVRCPGVVLPPMKVRSDGSFAFSGLGDGNGVRVEGRFVTPLSVRGTLRVGLPACRVARTGFSARLS
jgi:hypothetical protein